jgi:hypothetical protein
VIKADEVAVCFSGLPREEHEWVIKRTKKILPYDTFFATWKGRELPNGVDNCLQFDEPEYGYHNLIDTKTKPDCTLWAKYTRKPTPGHRGGKIWWKPNLLNQTKSNSKQILGHYYLVNSLLDKYKVIVKMRYDVILSSKSDYSKYIQKVQDENCSIGFDAGGGENYGPQHELNEHSNGDCRRCTGWYLWDHVLIHQRHRLKNVDKMFENKDLLGAEWGWHQVLHHQWNDKNYQNVQGGETLVKCCTAPREVWDSF